jgi:hypothetical protein
MNFHAIMPFYRKKLLQDLIAHFEIMNLQWHPVCDSVDIEAFTPEILGKYPWIQPLLCQPLQSGDQCYRKNNDFINSGNIIDDDYYGFIHDDDMYAPGFIDKIKQQTAKIIFYSMSRGDSYATDICSGAINWPPVPVILNKPEDVHVAGIDMCQYIVKGEILKHTKFGNKSVEDDGHFAVHLKTNYRNDFIIIPEIGINFNYFQPGRYTIKDNYFGGKSA